jgi:hypothetical protein
MGSDLWVPVLMLAVVAAYWRLHIWFYWRSV